MTIIHNCKLISHHYTILYLRIAIRSLTVVTLLLIFVTFYLTKKYIINFLLFKKTISNNLCATFFILSYICFAMITIACVALKF